MVVEVVAHRADHFMPHPQDGVLAAAPQPQMPPVHQEIDTVLLGCDREGVVGRHLMHHPQVADLDLVAARRTLLGPKRTRHLDR